MDKNMNGDTAAKRYGTLEDKDVVCNGCDSADACPADKGVIESHISKKLSFTKTGLEQAPQGGGVGFGGGNPIVLAALKAGESVLVLGSGIGLDCFLAALAVGDAGRVIGVESKPELIKKARANAIKGGHGNVEFKEGKTESLPLKDGSLDVVISNCMINLSKDKPAAFAEIFRVLKAGGRLIAADIMLLNALPADIQGSLKEYVGCLGGAILKTEYISGIRGAGFTGENILSETVFPMEHMSYDSTANAIMGNIGLRKENLRRVTESIVSIKLMAGK